MLGEGLVPELLGLQRQPRGWQHREHHLCSISQLRAKSQPPACPKARSFLLETASLCCPPARYRAFSRCFDTRPVHYALMSPSAASCSKQIICDIQSLMNDSSN